MTTEVIIDLEPYLEKTSQYVPNPGLFSKRIEDVWVLYSMDSGRKASKDMKLIKVVPEATKVIIKDPVKMVSGINPSFLKAFLGPTARKVGPMKLRSMILADQSSSFYLRDRILSYLSAEEGRIEQRKAAKVAKEKKVTKKTAWAKPQPLLVPDIGTKLRTVAPWEFKLHGEYRNQGFMEVLAGKRIGSRYETRKPITITINPGAILKVDRVYIRKGGGYEDFSSLTFMIDKGAEVVYNGKTIETTKSSRFWAKLSDVNRLMVEIDLNSLPGQELEGQARKN